MARTAHELAAPPQLRRARGAHRSHLARRDGLAAARGIVVGVVFGFFLWAGAIPAVRLLLVLT